MIRPVAPVVGYTWNRDGDVHRTSFPSPFTPHELARWRCRLMALRREIAQDLADVCHTADAIMSNHDQEKNSDNPNVAIASAIEDRSVVVDIDHALSKIDSDMPIPFGLCEKTGQIIEPDRLELMPWTRFCAAGAKLHEHSNKAKKPKRSL